MSSNKQKSGSKKRTQTSTGCPTSSLAESCGSERAGPPALSTTATPAGVLVQTFSQARAPEIRIKRLCEYTQEYLDKVKAALGCTNRKCVKSCCDAEYLLETVNKLLADREQIKAELMKLNRALEMEDTENGQQQQAELIKSILNQLDQSREELEEVKRMLAKKDDEVQASNNKIAELEERLNIVVIENLELKGQLMRIQNKQNDERALPAQNEPNDHPMPVENPEIEYLGTSKSSNDGVQKRQRRPVKADEQQLGGGCSRSGTAPPQQEEDGRASTAGEPMESFTVAVKSPAAADSAVKRNINGGHIARSSASKSPPPMASVASSPALALANVSPLRHLEQMLGRVAIGGPHPQQQPSKVSPAGSSNSSGVSSSGSTITDASAGSSAAAAAFLNSGGGGIACDCDGNGNSGDGAPPRKQPKMMAQQNEEVDENVKKLEAQERAEKAIKDGGGANSSKGGKELGGRDERAAYFCQQLTAQKSSLFFGEKSANASGGKDGSGESSSKRGSICGSGEGSQQSGIQQAQKDGSVGYGSGGDNIDLSPGAVQQKQQPEPVKSPAAAEKNYSDWSLEEIQADLSASEPLFLLFEDIDNGPPLTNNNSILPPLAAEDAGEQPSPALNSSSNIPTIPTLLPGSTVPPRPNADGTANCCSSASHQYPALLAALNSSSSSSSAIACQFRRSANESARKWPAEAVEAAKDGNGRSGCGKNANYESDENAINESGTEGQQPVPMEICDDGNGVEMEKNTEMPSKTGAVTVADVVVGKNAAGMPMAEAASGTGGKVHHDSGIGLLEEGSADGSGLAPMADIAGSCSTSSAQAGMPQGMIGGGDVRQKEQNDLDPPTPPPIPEAVLQQLEMLQQNFRQWVTNISLHALRLGLISVECAVDRFLTQSPVALPELLAEDREAGQHTLRQWLIQLTGQIMTEPPPVLPAKVPAVAAGVKRNHHGLPIHSSSSKAPIQKSLKGSKPALRKLLQLNQKTLFRPPPAKKRAKWLTNPNIGIAPAVDGDESPPAAKRRKDLQQTAAVETVEPNGKIMKERGGGNTIKEKYIFGQQNGQQISTPEEYSKRSQRPSGCEQRILGIRDGGITKKQRPLARQQNVGTKVVDDLMNGEFGHGTYGTSIGGPSISQMLQAEQRRKSKQQNGNVNNSKGQQGSGEANNKNDHPQQQKLAEQQAKDGIGSESAETVLQTCIPLAQPEVVQQLKAQPQRTLIAAEKRTANDDEVAAGIVNKQEDDIRERVDEDVQELPQQQQLSQQPSEQQQMQKKLSNLPNDIILQPCSRESDVVVAKQIVANGSLFAPERIGIGIIMNGEASENGEETTGSAAADIVAIDVPQPRTPAEVDAFHDSGFDMEVHTLTDERSNSSRVEDACIMNNLNHLLPSFIPFLAESLATYGLSSTNLVINTFLQATPVELPGMEENQTRMVASQWLKQKALELIAQAQSAQAPNHNE